MARRSRRSSARRRNKTRKQSGGGFFSWEGIKSLFTRKAPAAPANGSFSVVNPMAAARPTPVAQAPAPVINEAAAMRRRAALNNMTRRRQKSHLGNYINSEQARNNAAYRNAMNRGNQLIRNMGGTPPPRFYVEPTDPLDDEAEIEAEIARLSQGGGGLTEAEIEAAVNNI